MEGQEAREEERRVGLEDEKPQRRGQARGSGEACRLGEETLLAADQAWTARRWGSREGMGAG
jgi:hypothetical protein